MPRHTPPQSSLAGAPAHRKYLLEQIGEAAVVQVYADGFSALALGERTLIWHLYQAALAGRDIFYDQRYAHSLEMRDVLEAVITHADGIDPATLDAIHRYTKIFWINTGPYNNLTARKFVLTCAPDAFDAAVRAAARAGARVSRRGGETLDALLARLRPLFFDPAVDPTVTSKTPPPGEDLLAASANNLYVGVTMKDLEGFTERYALNSRLVMRGGREKPDSQRMISTASACADMESMRSMRAATGRTRPCSLSSVPPSTSVRPRVPAAW